MMISCSLISAGTSGGDDGRGAGDEIAASASAGGSGLGAADAISADIGDSDSSVSSRSSSVAKSPRREATAKGAGRGGNAGTEEAAKEGTGAGGAGGGDGSVAGDDIGDVGSSEEDDAGVLVVSSLVTSFAGTAFDADDKTPVNDASVLLFSLAAGCAAGGSFISTRSEERRVGKEGRS